MYQTKTTISRYALFFACKNPEIRWLITRRKPVLFKTVTPRNWNLQL